MHFIIWAITHECNLSCPHCYIKKDGAFIERKKVKCLLEDASFQGARKVAFTGGEPLLHPHLLQMIEDARRLNYRVFLNTNATLLNKEVALFLKKSDVFLYISVDGASARVHERIRGEGSFEALCKGIEEARRVRLNFATVSALTSLNVEDGPNLLSFAKKLGASFACFIPIIPKKGKKELLPNPLGLFDTLKEIKERAKRERFPAHLWCNPSSASLNDSHFLVCSCTESVDIDALGFLHPCDVMEERIVEVEGKDFSALLSLCRRHPLWISMKRLPPSCRGCKMVKVCGGGCRVRAYHFWGSMEAVDPLCYCNNVSPNIY